MNIPKVLIIVLNRNHRAYLEVAITSLKKQSYANINIIVVDNASTDDSIYYLSENHPDIKVFRNEIGLGWTGGNNVGIKYAIEMDADYILLANNDIELEDENLISKIVESFSHNQSLGILGPKVHEMAQKDKLQSSGWNIYEKYYKKGLYLNHYKLKDFNLPDYIKTSDFVSGCFICIKKEVFESVGLLDENIFLYGDEMEFSFRAWRDNYISAVNENLIVYHKGSATTGKISPLKIYYQNRNMIYFILKNKKDIHKWFIYMLIWMKDVVKSFLKFTLRIANKSDRSDLKLALYRAVIDGIIIKKYGQRYYE